MDNKEDIVKLFAPYCSKCDGQCCKRGVFSVFDWELEKFTDDQKAKIKDRLLAKRGTSHDVCINNLCAFSSGHGCTLPVNNRPTDCLTYPFYPKMDKASITGEVNDFVIDTECLYSKQIAEDKKLIKAVRNYWKKVVKKTNNEEITDWLGKDDNWSEWYKKAKNVKH